MSLSCIQLLLTHGLPPRPTIQDSRGRKPFTSSFSSESRENQVALSSSSSVHTTLSSPRSTGFSSEEVNHLLGSIEKILQLCRSESELGLRGHKKYYKNDNCTVDCLKRNFSSPHQSRIPTGDSIMPDDVFRAKNLRYQMTECAYFDDGP